jgi:hypothetical protein
MDTKEEICVGSIGDCSPGSVSDLLVEGVLCQKDA